MTAVPLPPDAHTAALSHAARRAYARAGWASTVALVAGALALRIAYLVWLCPYDLAEDEAQYWDWSRRLDLSYYTKGPGVAWAVRASTEIFGAAEWAVRLPAALGSALGALGVAALASDIARDRRAGFFAAALFLLAPMYQGIAQFMTIDSPYLAAWTWAAFFAWRAASRRSGPAWVAFAAVLGAGFLFKYTILLLLPGVALAALITKPSRTADARASDTEPPAARPSPFRPRRLRHWMLAAAAVFVVVISPVLVWNTVRGWPTLGHLLRRLESPDGAAATPAPSTYNPLWTLEFLGQQFAMGPAVLLAIVAAWLSLRSRRLEPDLWPGRRFLLLCAAPIFLFYLAVTFRTHAQGNWTLAGYATLIALIGTLFVTEMSRYRARVAEWLSTPPSDRRRRGLFRRKPETPFQVLWHWTLAAGLVSAPLIARIDLPARLPLVGPIIPVHRLIGARDRAAALRPMREHLASETGASPMIIAAYYGVAAQMAYYLPDRPSCFCARRALGGEPSAYDFFRDTDLASPALRGLPALLLGGATAEPWANAFETVEPLGSADATDRALFDAGKPPTKDGKHRVYAGKGYRGFGAAAPGAQAAAP